MRILFILMLLPIVAISQKVNPIAPKGANTIIVKGVSFNRVVGILLDSGYRFEKIDKDFQTVKTEYANVCPNCVPQVSYDILVKDSVLTLSGVWRSDGGILGEVLGGNKRGDYMYFNIQNIKGKVDQILFKALLNLAESFGGIMEFETRVKKTPTS